MIIISELLICFIFFHYIYLLSHLFCKHGLIEVDKINK